VGIKDPSFGFVGKEAATVPRRFVKLYVAENKLLNGRQTKAFYYRHAIATFDYPESTNLARQLPYMFI
jgi:hypothetical protein